MKINHFTKILSAAFFMCFHSVFSMAALPMGSTGENFRFQKTYAAIIAISDYQYSPAGTGGDLNYTDDDARKFYQYLVSPTGGKVAPQNVVLLINQAATKNAILKMLGHVFSKAKENDRVILYYSGHGQPGYIIPSDAHDAKTLISYDSIKRILKKCRAKTKLCFIDACNSDSIKSPGRKTNSNAAGNKKTNASVVIMVSSQSDQSSVEDSNLKQGAFSYFLLKGLKGEADTDMDKTVTIEELHKYVYFHVKKYTFGKQVPHTFGRFDLDMPVALLN